MRCGKFNSTTKNQISNQLIELDQDNNGIKKLINIGKYLILIYMYENYQKADSSYDGVLGGYGNLSSLDTNYSLRFILKLIKDRPAF